MKRRFPFAAFLLVLSAVLSASCPGADFYTLRLKLVLAALLLAPLGALHAAAPAKPNIIFILADDLGWAELGRSGQQKIRTPSIDRLAAEGVRFTHHYSGNAVCAPSRSVLLTGLHPGHTPIRDNRELQPEGQVPLPGAAVTLAELFKGLGYATGAMGKWGLGPPGSEGDPLRQGFDHFFGYNCQRHAHNSYPTYLYEDGRQLALENPALPVNQKLPDRADPAGPGSRLGRVIAPIVGRRIQGALRTSAMQDAADRNGSKADGLLRGEGG